MSTPPDEKSPVYLNFIEQWKLRRFRAQVYRMWFGVYTGLVCANIWVAFLWKGFKVPDKALLYLTVAGILQVLLFFAQYIILQLEEFRFKFLSEIRFSDENASSLSNFEELWKGPGRATVRGAWLVGCFCWVFAMIPFVRLCTGDSREDAVQMTIGPLVFMTVFHLIFPWLVSKRSRRQPAN